MKFYEYGSSLTTQRYLVWNIQAACHLTRYQAVSGGSKTKGQNKKPPVHHIPEKQSNDACGSPNMPMHLINHDPVEEKIVWMRNSLVEVISKGVNYQEIKHALIDNGVQFTGFGVRNRKLGGTGYHVAIQELDPLHFLVLEANEYKLKAFNLMLEEEDDETQSSSDGTPKAVSVARREADKTKSSSDGTPKVVSVKRDETRMCNKNVVNEELVELKQSIQLPPNGY
uniref:Uncharacterized protein n=1 Tax=Populus alba TaxID=43335 RepID=A0A4U5QSG9_POPAL|nr:hypothetical protein D5086_0000063360 [Populus alba]